MPPPIDMTRQPCRRRNSLLAVILEAISFTLLVAIVPSTAQESDQTVYYIYHESTSEDGCGNTAVSVRGQVIDNSFTLQRATSTIRESSSSCIQETFCLLDPTSAQCQSVTNGVPSTAQVSVTLTDQSGVVDSGGEEQLLECDTSNSDFDRPLCIFSPPPCSPSSAYPSCEYSIVTAQELAEDPTLLYNPNPPPEVNETVYAVYYSDAACTEIQGLEGFVVGAPFEAQGVARTVSCKESMACMLNPTGITCANIAKSTKTMSGVFNRSADDELVYCEGNDTQSCRNVTNNCVQSELYPDCYRSVVAGAVLFQEPAKIVTPPVPVDYPLNSTYYFLYYESEGSRGCFGSAVALEGGVIGDRKTFLLANTGQCSEETTCLLDPTSPSCIAVTGGALDTADLQVTRTSTGSLQLCDTSNVEAGEDLCLLDPPNCDASSLYFSCAYVAVTGTELLAAPNILENESPPPEAEDAVYLVYYTDDECVHFGALRGLMMNTPNQFQQVASLDLYTCQDALVCFLSPTGAACELMETTGTTTSYFRRGDESSTIFTCSGSNDGNDNCTETDFDSCQTSELYPGCYFRPVLGTDLLQRPVRHITPPTMAPSSSPTMAPSVSMAPSGSEGESGSASRLDLGSSYVVSLSCVALLWCLLG